MPYSVFEGVEFPLPPVIEGIPAFRHRQIAVVTLLVARLLRELFRHVLGVDRRVAAVEEADDGAPPARLVEVAAIPRQRAVILPRRPQFQRRVQVAWQFDFRADVFQNRVVALAADVALQPLV
jgi:hypothetical protein